VFKIIKNRFPDKTLQYGKKQGSQIKGVTYHEGPMKGEGADRFPVSGEKNPTPTVISSVMTSFSCISIIDLSRARTLRLLSVVLKKPGRLNQLHLFCRGTYWNARNFSFNFAGLLL